jgi:RNA polymerase sigma-70 factor (ECF subfamily)
MDAQAHERDAVEDAALARRVAAASDPEAESALCGRLFSRIRAYGLLHTRDDAIAADLAQHVLVVVIESLRAGKVEHVDRLAAFVMGACRNTLLDWRKGERRRHAILERFGPSFAQLVEPAEIVDRRRLEKCLAHLAARELSIVALTFFADLEGDEIARELGMSAGSVRIARHRAMTKLRECMTGAA